jgi:hypothetical protein
MYSHSAIRLFYAHFTVVSRRYIIWTQEGKYVKAHPKVCLKPVIARVCSKFRLNKKRRVYTRLRRQSVRQLQETVYGHQNSGDCCSNAVCRCFVRICGMRWQWMVVVAMPSLWDADTLERPSA